MLAMIEPIEAGILVASINELIINTTREREFWCGAPPQETVTKHEDSSSNTASINELEIHTLHFDPWMHIEFYWPIQQI